ncbi:hypothetical protein [Nannocystis pusilla]|uniref:hypothetical protein n=1 Tax=Nannocystis pusilla TaxID=889268 RepID=UPI003B8170F8
MLRHTESTPHADASSIRRRNRSIDITPTILRSLWTHIEQRALHVNTVSSHSCGGAPACTAASACVARVRTNRRNTCVCCRRGER